VGFGDVISAAVKTSTNAILLTLCAAACGDPTSEPAPDGPGPVAPATVTVRAPDSVPWLAVQNGEGAWEPVAVVAGVPTFLVDDVHGRYGVAIACERSAAAPVRVVQATTVEAVEVHLACPRAAAQDVFGDYIAASCATARVAAGDAAIDAKADPCGVAEARMFPQEAFDVVGISFGADGAIDRAFVARDRLAENGASLVVDFASDGGAPAVAKRVIAVSDAWRMTFHTDRARLAIDGFGSGPYPGIPASLRRPADIHELCASHACAWMRQPREVDARAPEEPRVTSLEVGRDQATVRGATLGFRVELDAWTLDVSPGWQRTVASYAYPLLCEVAGFPRPCLASTAATEFRALVAAPADGFSYGDIRHALDRQHALVPDGLAYGFTRFGGPLR
jgi:hypothetical protein